MFDKVNVKEFKYIKAYFFVFIAAQITQQTSVGQAEIGVSRL